MPAPLLPIELGVISLRPFDADDYADFCDYRNQPDVDRYVRWAMDEPDEARREAFGKRCHNRAIEVPGDILAPAIIDSASGRVIGEAMLRWFDNEHRQGEVGYGVHPHFQGRGIAGVAAKEMLRIGFDLLGLHRIHGGCDPRNAPSAAVLRRLGMREEGILREVELLKGEWVDEQVFAMLATEWRAK